MLLLTDTSSVIRVFTGSAANLATLASWVDNSTGVITPGTTSIASITTATTTTIVSSPSTSVQRNVRNLSITNKHASVTCSIAVEHYDGTNSKTLWLGNLAPSDTLILDEVGGWTLYNSAGSVYTSSLITCVSCTYLTTVSILSG